ncbi:MAG: SPFH domain-containing protein [Sutterella wadsworthensis]
MTATVVTRIVTTSVSSVLRPAATATTPVVTTAPTAPTARRAPAASSAASAAWEASAASAASVPICLRAARGRASACPVIVGLAVLAWGATGFYIVPEGQSGIVTTFGRYAETTAAGFRWHLPMPIQDVQIVDVSSVRTTEIGLPAAPTVCAKP